MCAVQFDSAGEVVVCGWSGSGSSGWVGADVREFFDEVTELLYRGVLVTHL